MLNNFDALANPSAEIGREQQGKWTEGGSVSVPSFSLLHRANILISVALEINIKPLTSLACCLVSLALLLLLTGAQTLTERLLIVLGLGFFGTVLIMTFVASLNHLLAGALEPQLSYSRLYDTSWEI